MGAVCTHLDEIEVTRLPEPVLGCDECLRTGSSWVHRRMCDEVAFEVSSEAAVPAPAPAGAAVPVEGRSRWPLAAMRSLQS